MKKTKLLLLKEKCYEEFSDYAMTCEKPLASVYIKGNCYSSKNSKIVTKSKAVISSKAVRTYVKNTKFLYKINKDRFIQLRTLFCNKEPIYVGFLFIRSNKQRFDYVNMVQIVADLMQEYEWINDDSAKIFNPVFLGYIVDKENAGVHIIPLTDLKHAEDYIRETKRIYSDVYIHLQNENDIYNSNCIIID